VLWLSLRFPHLPVELRQAQNPERLAVTDRAGPRRIVIACNDAARQAGIHAGMQATTALLKDPDLRLSDRSKSEERRAMRALADWVLQFSSVVCFDAARWLIWIEIGGSLHYFEGLSALRSHIEQGIAALHYSASIGIATTLEAAAVLSQYPHSPPALTRESIVASISPLPLTLLAMDDRAIEQLRATGLQTVGEVLGIPHSSLARRFGPDATDYLQRLLGLRPDPRRRHLAAARYRRRYEFPDPIESLEGLLFPLRRVLQEFQGYLRGRDTAIQRLELTLRHRDSADTAFTLHTSAPMRDALRLFALTREKLERIPWSSAVTDVIVCAQDFHAPDILQGDFFDDSKRRSAGWSALLDKLRARLGDQAVKQLGLRDDHRPEQAWCIQNEAPESIPGDPYPDRPLWLLDPIPVARPAKILGRPERIEAGWWSGADTTRDYYRAISGEGAHWWLYRDVGSDQWYLHGLWA
jgi:protein ImuB